jgi:hypothetical protein
MMLGKDLPLTEMKVLTANCLERQRARADDCRCQPRVGGFAFFMVTTRADTGDPIGFGGRR